MDTSDSDKKAPGTEPDPLSHKDEPVEANETLELSTGPSASESMDQPGDVSGEGVAAEVSPPPQRAKRTIVAAALVGALAGGLVAYPVALQVAERNSGGIPVFTNTAQGTASDELEDAPAGSVAAIVDAIRPSIVAVRTTSSGRDNFLQPVPAQGAGTGIVLDNRGHILTNAHVVEGAETIDVIANDGSSLDARVIGRDRLTDLAVLRVSADDLQPAKFGDSDSVRVGDPVIAVGHALALRGDPTVTVGIISALDRTIQPTEGTALEHVIQTDAAINPGNSGGPLLNVSGEVVGINTAIAGGAQSIGFAIAITPATEIVNQLVTDGQIVRPYLGVSMADVTPELAEQESLTVTEGAYVIQVVVDRGADRAGILPGDVIVEIEGEAITSSEDAVDVIAGYKPADRINIVVVRGSERLRLVATLTQRD